jgi:hypothetical protein
MSSARRLRRSGMVPQYSVMAVGCRNPIRVAMDAFGVQATADGPITWVIGCLPDHEARSLQTCPIVIAARTLPIGGRQYVQIGLWCPAMIPEFGGDCLVAITARPPSLPPDDRTIGYLVQILPTNPHTQVLQAIRVLGLSRRISELIASADVVTEERYMSDAATLREQTPIEEIFRDRPDDWTYQNFCGD